ncbi:DNA helicase [Prosthecomicrobium hirschii]|uniref:DNA helicase n=1 Tax=Prosthecodimorpha hirschii TaxID=665126 RepID=A0A0P6VVU2_9HYPH|nr:DNA helicase [Prosthecomicrobium hirschii]KPL55495.1 DNA helicase [Prosthecomicrobium hirschii]
MKPTTPIHQLKHRARLMARRETIPLHEALDRVARAEGFPRWSLLSARHAAGTPLTALLPRLVDGDLLLLGARPGQGKTLLGLQLLLDAARAGRGAFFFTLEYSSREARQRIRSLDRSEGGWGDKLEIVASDAICADFIIGHLSGAPRGTVAIIDYLQILDQQRSKPALADQVRALRDFASETGIVLGFISQIDRRFDPAQKPLPDITDIRLPNPVGMHHFTKVCFLHDGDISLQTIA